MAISRPLGAGHHATVCTDGPVEGGRGARASLVRPGHRWTRLDVRRYKRHTTYLQLAVVLGVLLVFAAALLSAF